MNAAMSPLSLIPKHFCLATQFLAQYILCCPLHHGQELLAPFTQRLSQATDPKELKSFLLCSRARERTASWGQLLSKTQKPARSVRGQRGGNPWTWLVGRYTDAATVENRSAVPPENENQNCQIPLWVHA